MCDKNESKENRAFGLPKGTIRAIITILLILCMFTVSLIILGNAIKQFSENLDTIKFVYLSLLQMVNIMIGYYVGKSNK